VREVGFADVGGRTTNESPLGATTMIAQHVAEGGVLGVGGKKPLESRSDGTVSHAHPEKAQMLPV
jgi:hypothetical protein